MSRVLPAVCAALLLIPLVPAAGQSELSGSDPRFQTIDYQPGTVVDLQGAIGYQTMVELSPDEQVQSISLGDSSSWQVSVNKAGDRLFLKPVQSGAPTNMTVVTSVRTYSFQLYTLPVATPDIPFAVHFRFPAAEPQASAQRAVSRYKIKGDPLVRPSSISDDGQRTFIAWPKTADIPAIYALDRSGRELMVNGTMGTDDVYVIDGAPGRLRFRIDRHVARADRLPSRRKP
jgi:type IV secretion system protein VirB9